MLHAVIMAGGSGTRFWPASRSNHPKQFLPLFGDETLIQATVRRVADWIDSQRTWVVTNQSHAGETGRQLPALPTSNIVREPCGRNTAPCIGLAAMLIAQRDPNGIMLVMPADHRIERADLFRQAVERAVAIVEREPALVLFGIRPSYPSVSFGYFERGTALPGAEGAFRVASFREKPDRAKAEEFVAAGRFFWNSGIFVWKASTILDALKQFEPAVFDGLSRLRPHLGNAGWDHALAAEFPGIKSISIDYGVLERADNVMMIEAPFDWDDVGSWQALGRQSQPDGEGNSAQGLFCGVDSRDCIIRTTRDHLVATIGMSDCIVVHTPDATLVARKDDEESIRRLVQTLRERGYERFL
ncbi:MAG TPA: mannose-1-phosphate guanylyltransferase [Planctomycetaceae bacterium]|jgi:mannose-1-phosphate guanylyltransferase|nr:mannose-1-phosphate guanylyltransferase [Planctomycetaceae bacterium]